MPASATSSPHQDFAIAARNGTLTTAVNAVNTTINRLTDPLDAVVNPFINIVEWVFRQRHPRCST